jgi:LysM domain
MIRSRYRATFAVALAFGAMVPASVWAQAGPPSAPPASGGGATVPSSGVPTSGGYAAASGFAFGAPQAANGTIGGGNATESSSHPVTGDEEDSFDYGRGGASGGAAHGDANGPVFVMGGHTQIGGEVPSTHVVKRGDTLWGICDQYFQNPYQWPRLWSYNPQVKNPHWIYPGDELRMKEGAAISGGGTGEGGGAGKTGPASMGDPNKMSIVDRRRQVPSGTVFLRDEGWLQDDSDEIWGDVSGSAGDKMFLSDNDELYLAIKPGHDVHLGQELTIFHRRMTAAAGQIVQILGTARVDDYNARDHIARAKIVETLDVIERGASIGPLERRFEIVPPRRNEAEVQARVLASVHPHAFYGQNQVVFIDKGEAAGLKRGNRLFILRRGDAWRQSLVTRGAGYRVSPDDERPMPPMEKTPGSKRQEDTYPDEVVGELRVLSLKKESAVCLVTQSRLEIESTDIAVARKGY